MKALLASPLLIKAVDANNYFGVMAEMQKLSANDRLKTRLVDEVGHSLLVRAIFGFGWPAPAGVVMPFGAPGRLSPHSRPCNSAALRGLLDGGINPMLTVDESICRTLLHSAILMMRPTEALLLMRYMEAKDIAAADSNGFTALHLAAERGMVRVVSALVGLTDIPAPSALVPALPPVDLDDGQCSGLDLQDKDISSRPCHCFIHPSTVTKSGGTALSASIRHGSLPTIDALLAAGANPNQKFFTGDNSFMEGYSEGRYCLHMAIMARSLGAVCSLLAAGADANAHTPTGYGALNFAIDVRNIPIIGALLSAGADPNAAGKSGHTPLYCAADRGLHEAVQLLLDNGAFPFNPYVPEMCPIDIACFRGHAKCFFEALEPNVSETVSQMPSLAMRSCQGGQKGLLEAMLQRGLPVTSDLLREACMRSPDILKLLLDHGGDIADCSSNSIPLCCPGVVEELRQQGAI